MRYSQYNEEEFLNDYFGNKIGFVVEIGAADGINNSNSRMLIEKGWSALLVEPNVNNFERLKDLYDQNILSSENDKNESFIILENCGCSDITDKKTFFIDRNDEYQQLSTFSEQQVIKCKNMYSCEFEEQTIQLIKTSDLFNKHNISKIDFLSIDTEAYDENVLNGINFSIMDIDIICIETDNSEIHNKLSNEGYIICFRTAGNILYKKQI